MISCSQRWEAHERTAEFENIIEQRRIGNLYLFLGEATAGAMHRSPIKITNNHGEDRKTRCGEESCLCSGCAQIKESASKDSYGRNEDSEEPCGNKMDARGKMPHFSSISYNILLTNAFCCAVVFVARKSNDCVN